MIWARQRRPVRAELWRLILLTALPLCIAACAQGAGEESNLQPPAAVSLEQLTPALVVPGSKLLVRGGAFGSEDFHRLRLELEGRAAVDLPLAVEHRQLATLLCDETIFSALGEGQWRGAALVISASSAGEVQGPRLPVELRLARHLQPELSVVGSGLVFLNSRVSLAGEAFLLGGAEGQTYAALRGCYLPRGQSGDCAEVGRQVQAQIAVAHIDGGGRERGIFEFAPEIAGLEPGRLEGQVQLINIHADGEQRQSAALTATFELERSLVHRFAQPSASLGQYLEIEGAGFIGGPLASTELRFVGSFRAEGQADQPLSLRLVPAVIAGDRLRYVLEEEQGIGGAIDLRSQPGTLVGSWQPLLVYNGQTQEGATSSLALTIAPVKQVVWVRFIDSWSDSLRLFGLSAADGRLRQRILTVMRRIYRGINVDFRLEEPTDFALFARLDLMGKDPNNLGILGYDNTPGKDSYNMRLEDWVGGYNALTQQDGYAGYGGVFLESFLTLSEHPPQGVPLNPVLSNALFDQIFDPFRPDRGEPLSAAELLEAPELSSGESCPAPGRLVQAACATFTLGNLLGTTAAHELGHSLGLANPEVPGEQWHNHGDRPNRLMDEGSKRPFAERAELQGQGPEVFCQQAYDYLRQILPADPPDEPSPDRPPCD